MQVQSSIRVAKESCGLPSSYCRANRPHLGLCPEANVPLQGRQGSRGCIPHAPGETGIPLEWKQRTPLCSRIATGIAWRSLGGLKGVKPPEAFGERSRDWSLGHRSEEHTSELQSPLNLVCRLLLEKKKNKRTRRTRKEIRSRGTLDLKR